MTDKLPPNLLALFAPRPALRYLPPADHAPQERLTTNVSGVGQFLQALKEYDDEYKPTESWLQRRDRIKHEKQEAAERLVKEDAKGFKPSEDPQIRGDAFKTLFVSRLAYETTSKDLEMEFGRFGPIERIRIVTNTHADEKSSKKKKNRGYAFIVYEREKDMKTAYKETDGIRIKDRRVLVDVERGRTVSGWRPRRFGGGLGGRGYTKAMPPRPIGHGGFQGTPPGPGGFRGAFRGGFGGPRGGGFRGGPRGGFGDRGGYGGRGGIGYQPNGFGGGAPEGAPSGPRGGRGGGYGGYGGGGGRGGGDERSGGYGGRHYEDRAGSGSNMEPIRPRDRGDRGDNGDRGDHGDRGGYRDRDYDRGHDRDRDRAGRDRDDRRGDRDGHSRKREYEGDGYDSRSKRRY